MKFVTNNQCNAVLVGVRGGYVSEGSYIAEHRTPVAIFTSYAMASEYAAWSLAKSDKNGRPNAFKKASVLYGYSDYDIQVKVPIIHHD